MKGTAIYLGATAASGAMYLLGSEVKIPDTPFDFGQIGALGVLAWFVWFMVSRQQPKQQQEYREDLAKARADYLAANRELRAEFSEEMRSHRQWSNSVIERQHAENKEAREKLITAVDRLTDSVDASNKK